MFSESVILNYGMSSLIQGEFIIVINIIITEAYRYEFKVNYGAFEIIFLIMLA